MLPDRHAPTQETEPDPSAHHAETSLSHPDPKPAVAAGGKLWTDEEQRLADQNSAREG